MSILGSNLKTISLYDTTRAFRTSEATSSSPRQIYSAVIAAYDTYIQLMLPLPAYQELRMGLVIERYRIDLWRRFFLAQDKNEQGNLSTYGIGFWALVKCILTTMLETFSETQHTMEECGAHTHITSQEGLAGDSIFLVGERSYGGPELPESKTTATKRPPARSLMEFPKTSNYALPEKERIERLMQTLCYWNNSLDSLTPTLERESLRRRLRAHFSNINIAELPNLEAAAAFLKHQDIERMAKARSVIKQEQSLEYRLEAKDFEWQEDPFQPDRPRTMATLRAESVLVDWQYCLDDRWNPEYRAKSRRRTQNLITILNTGLRPPNLSVLHCMGYLERSHSHTIGYAFRLPPGAEPGQNPITLHHLLCNTRKPDDVPDLGKRFQLAKALVSTVFETHTLGWLHKNIRPKNILFWPKPNSKAKIDISKPYLIGFDIPIPDQPDRFLWPSPHSGDDHYRHPLYRGTKRHSFQPSFDMYSLGVVLFQIGVWRCETVASQAAPGISGYKPSLTFHKSTSEYIDTLLENGTVGQLERCMGKKYRDAVIACLARGFDDIWEEQEGDREKQLHTYLEQVQNNVVDAIGVCSA